MSQKEKNEKGVFEMTDGIGRIFGSNYGLGGFGLQRKETSVEPQAQAPVVQDKGQEVDPNKVMEFLSANNIFVQAKSEAVTEVSPEVRSRIEGFMENFTVYYSVVEREFGKEMAPVVMDLISDKLMAEIA